MHQIADHARCADCHQPHREKQIGRATCLACHLEQRDHESQATECHSCHVFGAP
jgi:hypothetical protein